MSNWTTRIACVLIAFVPAAYADKDTTKSAASDQNKPIALDANELEWTAAPPDLSRGARMAIVFGHPKKPGMFTTLYKVPAG